ncbi:MAG: hypothetical protein COX57_07240 [Alphaproteobacteria bacterium CG_4_10_14_0_2_um_filter_63_37]|nr:MAG: hypothetical protein AUJ55_02045 [Proteobacteria bacterium CG1_02_64_396]PJA24669.1 MAG: hypothetical protein COX57_07240 [Alphaproteobacteria bacterium CG_4_10_14_0_2_um_filter_63_37]
MAPPTHPLTSFLSDAPDACHDSTQIAELLAGQNRLLAALAQGQTVEKTLWELCALIDEHIEGGMSSVLLADREGKTLGRGLAPKLPADYAAALNGLVVGECAGSCGTAAFRGEAVIVTDIATDPLWAPFRDLALDYNIRACWSVPFMSSQRRLLGTFAVSHDRPRTPTPFERQVMVTAAALAAVAVEHAQNRRELLEAREWSEVTLQSIVEGVITTHGDGTIRQMNREAERLTGWTLAEAQGRPFGEVVRLSWDEEGDDVAHILDQPLSGGQPIALSEGWLIGDRYGNYNTVEGTVAPIRSDDGAVLGMVMVLQDVGEARRMADRLSYQESHDALTGLLNRRSFSNLIDEALSQAIESAIPAGVAYLDLDQFKVINDTCGHVAGDELLRELGQHLEGAMERRGMLARLGGDEFGVLFPGADLEESLRRGERLLGRIADFQFIWGNRTFQIGCSMGIADLDAACSGAEEVMRRVDIACFLAKDSGRNRIHLYRDSDAEVMRRFEELDRAASLHQALREGRFLLYGQPIFSLEEGKTGRFSRIEVLVRMLDTAGHLLLPAAFIPAAERYHVMSAIDRWVIRNALLWLAKIPESDLKSCSINLSGNALDDPGLLEEIRSALFESGVAPRRVCFEITETQAVANLKQTRQLIAEIKRLGCKFALDDFGAGMASFAYLKNLPVDFLKIDGSFVQGILTDPVDRTMVDAACRIARAMGILTIAEFVEEQGVFEDLHDLGVDAAQGFFLGRPQPLATLFPVA